MSTNNNAAHPGGASQSELPGGNCDELKCSESEKQRAAFLAVVAADQAWINWAELTLHHRIRMPFVRDEIDLRTGHERRNAIWLEAFPERAVTASFRDAAIEFREERRRHEARA